MMAWGNILLVTTKVHTVRNLHKSKGRAGKKRGGVAFNLQGEGIEPMEAARKPILQVQKRFATR